MALPNKVPVKVARRSGFDKSHVHQGTSLPGTIYPIMLDEVIPNSKVNLRLSIGASMPPLASDAYMKCDLAVEAFFVPLRLCYGGFESWFCQREDNVLDTFGTVSSYVPNMPVAQLDFSLGGNTGIKKFFGNRSLADALGMGYPQTNTSIVSFNPLPFVAYHLCWQHYYRQSLVQKECFVRPSFEVILDESITGSAKPYTAGMLPYMVMPIDSYIISCDSYASENQEKAFCLADGVSLFSLRQRNWDYDYFTNAFPTPTLGDEMSVDTVDGAFTIASLRAANALQEFSEKNQLAGVKFADTLKSRYGASLANGVANRPICLGSARYNIYNKGALVTATNPSGNSDNTVPWSDLAGTVLGNAYASGSDFLINGFVAEEPGYVLVNCTLVPTATYSSAVDRIFTRYCRGVGSITDMPTADLQGTGNEPIYVYELNGGFANSPVSPSGAAIFGYTDRYASFMTKHDRISGLFREGNTLSAMVLQRGGFVGSTGWRINSSFLEIPTNALDGVLVEYTDGNNRFGYWFEAAFDYKVSMPLSQYSLPSLVNPAKEHGETVTIHRGGFRF